MVTRRHPHELLLLAVSVLTGVAYLLGAPRPGSVDALLPHWQVTAWACALLASGLLGISGVLWPRYDLGLALEGGAMLIGAGGAGMYLICVLAINGWNALLSGGVVAAWAGANLWRAGQIRAVLRELA
jgi:hypothetical protein